MGYSKSISDGIYVLEIALATNFPNKRYTVDTFSKLDLVSIFVQELKLSMTTFHNTFLVFRALGIVRSLSYGELTIDKLKFIKFKKDRFEENENAQNKFKAWQKKSKSEV